MLTIYSHQLHCRQHLLIRTIKAKCRLHRKLQNAYNNNPFARALILARKFLSVTLSEDHIMPFFLGSLNSLCLIPKSPTCVHDEWLGSMQCMQAIWNHHSPRGRQKSLNRSFFCVEERGTVLCKLPVYKSHNEIINLGPLTVHRHVCQVYKPTHY